MCLGTVRRHDDLLEAFVEELSAPARDEVEFTPRGKATGGSASMAEGASESSSTSFEDLNEVEHVSVRLL